MPKSSREMAEMLSELGHDERHVAEIILGRLCMGRKAYGQLEADVDQRDFHWEALEELVDAVVYLAIATYRLGKEKPRAKVTVVDPPVVAEALQGGNGKPENGHP